MTQDEVIKLVQGNQLPQYDICDAEAVEGDVFIDLKRRDGAPYTCVYCGQSCLFAYDAMPRRCVADIPLGLDDETVRRIDKEFLAKRELIADKFHVFKYAGDALEELRRSEYNRQADKVMDFDLKRGRFLPLKSNVHLDDRGKAWITRLKEANDDVYTAYLLKEQAIARPSPPVFWRSEAWRWLRFPERRVGRAVGTTLHNAEDCLRRKQLATTL